MKTPAEPSTLTVVIADHRPHFRETLRRVLVQRTQAAVAGEADTLHSALRLVRTTGANVVLLATGSAGRPERLRVTSPGGAVRELRDVPSDVYLVVVAAGRGKP